MRKTVANQVKNPRRSARSVEIPSLASGWQTFKYGKLGEVIENIRTFALPFENQPYTFKMQYEYDSWNRIQKMTYPDGEEVHYEYNLGGMLEKMSGNKNGVQYTYIDSIAYNEFELKSAVFYGNGTRTRYEYDTLQRLSHLLSECADGVMQDLYYDYDDVSNITSIDNYAGILPNGLGGRYHNDYTYDKLYRLVNSEGWWDGDRYLQYGVDMSYLKNGRLQRKSLVTETWIDGNPTPINYDNIYRYQNDNQPNTVTSIDGSHPHEMQWDAKGNMVFHRKHYAGYDRRLCWDEQNRLLGVKDDRRQFSYYQYDANGDRVYKLSGEFDRQNVSGMWWHFYQLNNATLYASPYVVATRHGYTKHYYAENERVASRIGGGGLHGLTMTGNGIQDLLHPELPLHHPSCIPTEDEFIKKNNVVTQHAGETARCLDSEIRAYAPLESLAPFSDILIEEPDCYWYHPDHLGSSSWITSSHGEAVQHLHYLSWGEDYVNQRTSDFSARYTFSAKEKDAETGYSYFGSRYYSSDLSIWLSVDPQASKYPSLSPYVYCANNPVKLVDPNGEEIWIPEVDGRGNVTYTAEKGDSFDTFVHQFDCRGADGKNKAREIFAKAGLKSDGTTVKEGTEINGEDVKKVTGSDVLKGNWLNMTKRQKAAQLIFAVNHSKKHGDGSGVLDFNNYASGFETFDSEQLSGFYLPTKCGFVKVRNLSIWFTNSNTRSYNVPMVSQTGNDCINKYDFRFPEPGSKRSMFMFSIDGQYDKAFQTLFVK